MPYLRKRGKTWHFRRRIPKKVQHLFKESEIQVALDTRNRVQAEQRSHSFNQVLEEFWQEALILDEESEVDQSFQDVYQVCKRYGFQYRPLQEIVSEASPSEFLTRLYAAYQSPDDWVAEIILGGASKPALKISKTEKGFLEHEEAHLTHCSENQMRKWRNPKTKAIRNFISAVGDKDIQALEREDILRFRKWWVDRIEDEGLTANSANKDFGVIKKLVMYCADLHHLDLPVETLFRNTRLREKEKNTRYPFETKFIRDDLLSQSWKGNDECRWLVHIMADTGCRVSEITGLMDEDIFLYAPIPYISIRPNEIRALKTPQSQRDIPLVGTAFIAFSEMTGAFRKYRGKADLISTTINKYARENKIFPSANHSLYSLRHSFEDRLTAVEPPDKVQAALMGHKYSRPRYGHGPSLEQKKLWLDKITFEPTRLH